MFLLSFLKRFFSAEKFFFIVVPHNQKNNFKLQFSISKAIIAPVLLFVLVTNIYGSFLFFKIQYKKHEIATKTKIIEKYRNQTEAYYALLKDYSIYLANPLDKIVTQFGPLTSGKKQKNIGGPEVALKPEQQIDFVHNTIKTKSDEWENTITNLEEQTRLISVAHESTKSSMKKIVAINEEFRTKNKDSFFKDIPNFLPISLTESHLVTDNKNIYSFNLDDKKENVIATAPGKVIAVNQKTNEQKVVFEVVVQNAYGIRTIYDNLDNISPNIKKTYSLKKGEIIAQDRNFFDYKIKIGNKFINPNTFVYY